MASYKMAFLQACSPLQINQILLFIIIKEAYIQIDAMFEQEGEISWPPDLQEVYFYFCDFYILMNSVHMNTLCSYFNLQITISCVHLLFKA